MLGFDLQLEYISSHCQIFFVGSQDENRYNAGRGAHINLKRAERARVNVIKIPGIAFDTKLSLCKVLLATFCS